MQSLKKVMLYLFEYAESIKRDFSIELHNGDFLHDKESVFNFIKGNHPGTDEPLENYQSFTDMDSVYIIYDDESETVRSDLWGDSNYVQIQCNKLFQLYWQ